ncbi:MAG TPA: ABC transporter substrate-binding protein [Nitrospira sp.]|nr:ABC transporter substrate-binding protein [Nitrospira sp.]
MGVLVRLLAVLFLIGVPVSGVLCAGDDQAESPTSAVRETLEEVLRILDDPSFKAQNRAAERRQRLEDTISKRFDYREMARRTLASQWKRLSEQERDEFVELFKQFLSDRYAGRIEQYSGERVEYLSERREGPYAEVRTKLVSSKTQYPIDYRLMNKGGRWYAYDIVADGISLVKNYRSQFEKIIRNGSYQELVARLREGSVPDERQVAENRAPR